MFENRESIQLLNTAIIKSKEKKIDSSYEDRLASTCQKESVEALSVAINFLSDKLKISRDHAAVQLIETVRELDSIWQDYILMEGMSKLKELLRSSNIQ